MPVTTTALSLTFSHEELAYLLWVLKTTNLPGMPENPFAGLSDQQVLLLLASAERSLSARSLIQVNADRSVNLDESLLVLLGPCTRPESSLLVTLTHPNGEVSFHHFHQARHLSIAYTSPQPGLHTFTLLESPDQLVSMAARALALTQHPKNDLGSFTLTEAQLFKARDEILGKDGQQALRDLQAQGVAPSLAEAFLNDLKQPLSNTSLLVANLPAGAQSVGRGCAFLEGKNMLWWLTSARPEDPAPVFTIQSVASAELENVVKSYLG